MLAGSEKPLKDGQLAQHDFAISSRCNLINSTVLTRPHAGWATVGHSGGDDEVRANLYRSTIRVGVYCQKGEMEHNVRERGDKVVHELRRKSIRSQARSF